jgi:hypothetical protein
MTYAHLHLDLETTALDVNRDEIWEASYILDNADGVELLRREFLVEHHTQPVPWVLEKTHYREKFTADFKPTPGQAPLITADALIEHVSEAVASAAVDVVYLVGANPAFDDRFLRKIRDRIEARNGVRLPWYYHQPLDVSPYAAGAYRWPAPRNLTETAIALGILSADGDRVHGSHPDVELSRAVFRHVMGYKPAPSALRA